MAAINYIVDWASESNWKKHLINKIFLNDSDDFEDETLLKEIIDLITSKEDVELKLLKQTQEENDLRLVINEIKRPVNINALSSDTAFKLGGKLNVFYGENGSGKSSYVRVFRKLAKNYHTSSKDIRLLPNVYLVGSQGKGTTLKQSIDVSYTCNGAINPINEVDINEEHSHLMQMNVFDSDSVVPLLNSNLTFSVLPQGFKYFNKIVAILDSLRTKMDSKIASVRTDQGNIFRDSSFEIIRSEIKYIIQNEKRFDKLKEFISKTYPFNETMETEITQLDFKIKESEGSNVSDKLKILRSQKAKLESLVSGISKLSNKLSGENIEFVNQLIDEYAGKVREERKQNEDFSKGVSYLEHVNEEWYSIIRNTKEYYQALKKDGPKVGECCVLCSQELTQSEVEIINSSIVHVCSELHSEKAKLIEHLDRNKITDVIDFKKEDEEIFEKEILVEKIRAIISLLHTNIELFNESISSRRSLGLDTMVDFTDVTKEIEAEYLDLGERIQSLSKSTNEMQELLKTYKTKKQNLVKAKLINDSLSMFEKYYSLEDYIQTLASIKSGFATTAITRKAKEAFSSIVEQTYTTTFNNFCDELKVKKVDIKLTPQRGQTHRSKYVINEGYKVTDIMSEGEQKAIAMAEFATDLTIRRNFNTVLFDDPVTSLDYKRSELFARLIYNLSKERQVIVFTHNIMFYYYLYNECATDKDKENKFFIVDEFDKDNKGIVSESFSGRLENLSEVTKKIKQYHQKINSKSCTGDELEECLKASYSNIRTWCELIVEEGFFKDLIKRYEPNIRFTVINKINTEFVGELETVASLFDKACRWMLGHSQPTETQNSKATRQDFNVDYEYIISITDRFKTK
ncbi:AAA family ATPase [Cohnella thailandensis]|uniref:AAA family ATPase n=1 Tax=Cohnella thailandensis TaxID=557557 RepID=A0A841T1E6_9BACL|nr:AAA family ATPase [Cohnella thailandensis]MBB6635687.1 AAA family ATPase [Cohnella thailandensis]MBP1976062.1 energy-coupling factor transporter ATP-binding protein EcfA2 [Cohnella thailandensis]